MIGDKKMIKTYDNIIDGKRIVKYKMTEEEIASAEEERQRIEQNSQQAS